jgi:hypothetical protein
MSYRSDIADAIKAQLEGQTDAADDSIFTCLERPLGPDDLPAIVIYTMTSRRGESSAGSSVIPRVVTVAIEAAVSSAPASAQSAAEALAEDIEAAMDADRTLGNLVEECGVPAEKLIAEGVGAARLVVGHTPQMRGANVECDGLVWRIDVGMSSGVLDALLDKGYRYANISNADNLGAAPSATLAGWFAASGAPYAAELCRRTPADRKGGHLAIRRSDGRLILRDTAQTALEEMDYFTDEHRHPYFHCNNLWFDLEELQLPPRDSDASHG